uniref:CUB domain-containing protein n=1 Tax=Romanomermis culicivorax TaxID=13658 RepID=A0A915L1T9_ROMCU
MYLCIPSTTVKPVFTEFEIEPHQDCAYDRIEVYDGNSANNALASPNVGKFCGLRSPDKITSTRNE